MNLKLPLYAITLLLLLPTLSNALTFCTQETATESNACGGLATGSYSVSSWTGGGAATFDGNWGSNDATAGTAFLLVNYTIPIFAIDANWTARTTEYDNTTLNQSVFIQFPTCFNGTGGKLILNVTQKAAGTTFYCRNNTGWNKFASSSGAATAFFEEAITWTLNVTTTPNATLFQVYDEITLLPIVSGSVIQTNSTNTTTYTLSGNTLNLNTPPFIGYQNFLFQSTAGPGYRSRNFYYTTPTGFETDIYLINNSYTNTGTQQINVLNNQGSTISGAVITVNKLINGAYTVLQSTITDSSGNAAPILDCNGAYTVVIDASGYNEYAGGLTVACPYPTTFSAYLQPSSSYEWPQQPFQNVTITIFPQSEIMDNYTNVGYTISSATNDLDYYNLTLYGSNGTLISTTSQQPGGSGSSIQISYPKYGYNHSYITLAIAFKSVTMSQPYTYYTTRNINYNQDYSVPSNLNSTIVAQGFAGGAISLIPIFVAVSVVGLLASVGYQGGLGIVFILIIGVFVFMWQATSLLFVFFGAVAVAAAYLYSRSVE